MGSATGSGAIGSLNPLPVSATAPLNIAVGFDRSLGRADGTTRIPASVVRFTVHVVDPTTGLNLVPPTNFDRTPGASFQQVTIQGVPVGPIMVIITTLDASSTVQGFAMSRMEFTGTEIVTADRVARLVSVAVTPAAANLPLAISRQFAAMGTYSDGTTANVTALAKWSSADSSIAAFSNPTASPGLATGIAVGTVRIAADLATVTGSTLLTVTSAGVTKLRVTPVNPRVPEGGTQQFTATGIFSDGTTQDVTPQASWLSGSATIATVSATGLVRGITKGTTTITATLNGCTDTGDVTVIPGVPSLAFTVQPSNVASGSSITPSVQVEVRDVNGNRDLTATDSITIALGANPAQGTLSGTKTQNAVAGVATFSDLSIDKAAGGYALVASTTRTSATTSTSFTVTPGTQSRLAFTVQPSQAMATVTITPAVQVAIQDANGNTVTTANSSVAVDLGTNPAAGTLSGTTSRIAVNGIATFDNLSIDKVADGYTLAAAATGLTGATSHAFNIVPYAGPPAKLAFKVEPSNAMSSATMSPSVQVVVQDALGTTVTSATNSITIALASNPASGTLSGTLTQTAVNGVATFDNLSVDKMATGYTLMAAANGLTSATSGAFDISAGVPAKLSVGLQPGNATAGAAIAPALEIRVLDAHDNFVSTATNAITVGIGSNPHGGVLSGTKTRTATAGVATFDDLSIDRADTGYTLSATSGTLSGVTSSTFDVSAGAASRLAFTVQPTSVVTNTVMAPPVQVSIRDAYGNPVTTATHSVSLAFGNNPTSATLGGTPAKDAVAGVAVFDDLTVDRFGTGYTLTATSGGLTSATSDAFDAALYIGPPAKLGFVVQPGNATSTSPFSVRVAVQDEYGTTVPTATNSVTIAIGTNAGSGTLSGTLTGSAVKGLITFDDLSIDRAGTGYTLAVTSPSLTSGTSASFDVAVGAPTTLAFSAQPANAAAGVAIAPAIKVSVLDAGGNVVTSATDAITLSILSNPASGTLSGTNPVSASSGVASFADIAINKKGTGYTLQAQSGTLTPATSTPFDVTDPVLVSVAVRTAGTPPPPPTVIVNQTLQLAAVGTLSDGSTQDLTPSATWQWASNPDGEVTVSAGLVTGVTPGTVNVTATVSGLSGSLGCDVLPAF